MIDDVSDEGADLAAKQRGLAKWRAALDQVITEQDQVVEGSAAMASPFTGLKGAAEILPALVDTIERYKMPTRYLHDLISGAEMDLTIQTLSVLRAAEGILLSRGWNGGTDVHAHFWLP